ncbi:MAG: YhcH/YjgK/YiaL family protein [Armatimonadota bacterium]
MIIDNIRNALHYYALSKGIESGLKFLETHDPANLELGRHEIDGDDCFALVMEYESKPIEKGVWEAHKRYIDIQYVAKGVEVIGYADINDLTVSREYDEKADVMFLEGSGDMITVKEGVFAIFAPHDAHMPQVALEEPLMVRKVVVKVRAM